MAEILLIVHIIAGSVCLVCGLGAMFSKKRKGKHTKFGQIYHGSYVAVFLTAVLIAILHWEDSQYLFYIALFSYGLALMGFLSVKMKKMKKWLTLHISGMLGSYIGIVTATLVVNVNKIPILNELPVIYYWFLPTLIGTPLIFTVGQKYKPKKRVKKTPKIG